MKYQKITIEGQKYKWDEEKEKLMGIEKIHIN